MNILRLRRKQLRVRLQDDSAAHPKIEGMVFSVGAAETYSPAALHRRARSWAWRNSRAPSPCWQYSRPTSSSSCGKSGRVVTGRRVEHRDPSQPFSIEGGGEIPPRSKHAASAGVSCSTVPAGQPATSKIASRNRSVVTPFVDALDPLSAIDHPDELDLSASHGRNSIHSSLMSACP
jgi:hypothetical protein